MKKLAIITLTAVILLSLSTGCGKESPRKQENNRDSAPYAQHNAAAREDLLAFAESTGAVFIDLAEQLQQVDSATQVAAILDRNAGKLPALAALARELEQTHSLETLHAVAGDAELRTMVHPDALFDTADFIHTIKEAIHKYIEDPAVLASLERWQEAAETIQSR